MQRIPLVAIALIGCVDPVPWADRVVSAPGADPAANFGDPELAVNGSRGAGCCQGGMDVYALDPSLGRHELVLEFAEPVFDGPGDDLVVMENPFDITGGGRFMDPTIVEVSVDGDTFIPFPHAYLAPDPSAYSDDPQHWVGFAGIEPVLWNEDDSSASFENIGGDRFDLSSLVEPVPDGLSAKGIRFVRLIPATTREDSATGRPFPNDPISNGPDIDAVYSLAAGGPPG